VDNLPVRVLVIEDNGGDARLIQEALRHGRGTAFAVEVTDTLDAGLARMAAEIDVVLLDLSLPDAFGIDTFRRARAQAPSIPIVVLTGNDDEALATSAVNEGAQDFLSKQKLDGEILARSIRYAIERHRLLEQARQMATIDELTGLVNRRGFSLLCQHHFAIADRNRMRLQLLYLDLDAFKSVNDTFGHPEGDRALRLVAEVLLQTFRKSDVVARLGGDEFCVLLTSGSVDGAGTSVERLRANLETANATAGRPYRLSMSVGVGTYEPERPVPLDALMQCADEAMYAEKSARRRVAS
jgi:diguanylate cyclase (GGDEF)-like protein